MKFRSKVFLSALSFTIIGLASLALTFSISQAHQNAAAQPDSHASTSAENYAQTADPMALTSQSTTSSSSTTSNSSSQSTSTSHQTTTAAATNTASAPTFKGVTLNPSDKQDLLALRDFLELNGFKDVQLNSPYYDSTLLLQVFGIFKGYTDGTAGLNNPLSRAQAASILNRTFGFSLFTSTGTVFADVPVGSTHEKAINALYWSGITNGCSATPRNYCPTQAVTRKQFATLLAKSLQSYGISAPQTDVFYTYSDVPVGDSARSYVNYLTQLGLMNGCGNGKFCPNDALTRGQAVTIMARLLYGSELEPNRSL